MDFEKLRSCAFNPKINNSRTIYNELKYSILDDIVLIISSRKKLNRGPKPNPKTILGVLDALFEQLDNGSKLYYLEKHYNISRGTYYRYLKIISEYNLFQKYNDYLRSKHLPPLFLILDATHIRSLSGSEGVDFGYKEHGKKALKLTILTNSDKIIYLEDIHPDNIPDHIAFKDTATSNPLTTDLDVLADSGYNGNEFKRVVKDAGYNIISPRKKKSRLPPLAEKETIMLKKHRATVEHTFAHLKTKRSLQIKTSRLIWVYKVLLDLAILINNLHFGIVKNNLIKKPILKLIRK
jgi:hypothetical protein